jgi:hypothetical protein
MTGSGIVDPDLWGGRTKHLIQLFRAFTAAVMEYSNWVSYGRKKSYVFIGRPAPGLVGEVISNFLIIAHRYRLESSKWLTAAVRRMSA